MECNPRTMNGAPDCQSAHLLGKGDGLLVRPYEHPGLVFRRQELLPEDEKDHRRNARHEANPCPEGPGGASSTAGTGSLEQVAAHHSCEELRQISWCCPQHGEQTFLAFLWQHRSVLVEFGAPEGLPEREDRDGCHKGSWEPGEK